MSNEAKYTMGEIHTVNVAFGTDTFTPTLIGKLLGGIHYRKINRYLEELGLVLPGQACLTTLGKEYATNDDGCAPRWKFTTIELIAEKYGLAIDKNLANASYRYQFYLREAGISL